MPQPHLSLAFNPSTIVTNQTGLRTRYAWKWHDVEQFLFIYFSLLFFPFFFFGLLMILCFFLSLLFIVDIPCLPLFFYSEFFSFFLLFFKECAFYGTIFRGANRKYYFWKCLNRIRCFILNSFYCINYLWSVFIICAIVFSSFCDRGYKLY